MSPGGKTPEALGKTCFRLKRHHGNLQITRYVDKTLVGYAVVDILDLEEQRVELALVEK